jgi:hypothetical protein
MNKIKIVLCIILLFSLIGCKKEVECSWSMSYLNGKTYQVYRVDTIKNGVFKDISATFLSDPCNNGEVTFYESTYSTRFGTGCSNQPTSGDCATITENGKTFLVNYGINPFKMEVINFICDNFQTVGEDSMMYYYRRK